MYFKLTGLFIMMLISISLPGQLYSAERYIPPQPEKLFAPFDDDPEIYNDCNYCHGLHNARRDVSAVLNNRAERYERYLGGSFLAEDDERSVFAEEGSSKCPRSR